MTSTRAFEEWAQIGSRQAKIREKEQLAIEIMRAAIVHVEELGFSVKCGMSQSNKCAKLDLKADRLFFYHPEKL